MKNNIQRKVQLLKQVNKRFRKAITLEQIELNYFYQRFAVYYNDLEENLNAYESGFQHNHYTKQDLQDLLICESFLLCNNLKNIYKNCKDTEFKKIVNISLEELSKMTENEFISKLTLIKQIARHHKNELILSGITEDIIKKYEKNLVLYENASDLIEEKKKEENILHIYQDIYALDSLIKNNFNEMELKRIPKEISGVVEKYYKEINKTSLKTAFNKNIKKVK